MYFFGEWISPDERARRIADEHSEQDTEDEEELHPEMAYIDHTQNDYEPNNIPSVVGGPGADPPPQDDAQQQSAGALTLPPQVADGLPAAGASSSSRGRLRSRADRHAEGERSLSRGDRSRRAEEASESSDGGDEPA